MAAVGTVVEPSEGIPESIMTPSAWLLAQNAAISIGARIDAPVAAKGGGFVARASREYQVDPADPANLRTERWEGKGPTPDASLGSLVKALPDTVAEPSQTQQHCPTCTCPR